MAGEPQGVFYYNGYAADSACSIMRGVGIAPSQISMQFILGANLQPLGDCEIWYGRQRISLPDCRVVRQRITPSGGRGRWKELLLEDHRWRWRYGAAYGEFNLYEKGTKVVVPANRKNVQELATLLIQVMGERVPDVSMLPKDVYPPTDFDGQPPATLLERLVEEFGCHVVYNWDNTIGIVKRGVGYRPPTNDPRFMDFEITYEPPLVPERLIIESGRTLWQMNLPLEPVGEEYLTKRIKPIDELSYKPDSGWENAVPGEFKGLDNPKLRELAVKCIWKMFRVKPPFTVPTPTDDTKQTAYWYVIADKLWRILPLEERQLDLYRPERRQASSSTALTTDVDLTPAQIIGYFHNESISYANRVTNIPATVEPDDFLDGLELDVSDPELIYQGGFSLDTERALIVTSDPLYIINRDDKGPISPSIKPPKIFLRTSFILRDPVTRSPLRQQYEVRPAGGVPGVVKTIRVESLVYEIGPDQQTPREDFEAEAAYFAEQELLKYQVGGESATIPAMGFLFDYNVDGAIRSVAFMRDGSGRCTSRIEWQTEDPTYRVTYDQEKKERKVAAAVAELDKANASAKKQRGRGGRRPVQ